MTSEMASQVTSEAAPAQVRSKGRAGLPTVEQVDQLGEVMRKVAPKDWEDLNGHVNVFHHFRTLNELVWTRFRSLGMLDEQLHKIGNSMFTVEQHARYFDEVLVGHEISGHVRILERSEKMVHCFGVVVNRTTGRIANTLQIIESHVSMTTRRSAPWHPELAARIDEAIAEHASLDWQFPLVEGMGLRR